MIHPGNDVPINGEDILPSSEIKYVILISDEYSDDPNGLQALNTLAHELGVHAMEFDKIRTALRDGDISTRDFIGAFEWTLIKEQLVIDEDERPTATMSEWGRIISGANHHYNVGQIDDFMTSNYPYAKIMRELSAATSDAEVEEIRNILSRAIRYYQRAYPERL